jgi:hypothetical protein
MWLLSAVAALVFVSGDARAIEPADRRLDSAGHTPGPSLDSRQAWRLWRLTVALRLEPAVATRVFQIMDDHRQARADLRRKHGRLMQELDSAVDQQRDAAYLSTLVDRWLSLQQQRRQLQEARWRALQAFLSPVQQAQLMVLLPRLDHVLRPARPSSGRQRSPRR